MLVSADGMYFRASDGRQVLDATSGLWCVNAGHCRRTIGAAIRTQAELLDFAPTFQLGHPGPFELANKLVTIMPEGLDRVFFTNSGSESADTALKMALAYHRGAWGFGAGPADWPRARLSRHQFRRHVGRRYRRQPARLRSAGLGHRPSRHHAWVCAGLYQGQSCSQRRFGRRARTADRSARTRDNRRGDRRAGRGIGRCAGAAAGLSVPGSARSREAMAFC